MEIIVVNGDKLKILLTREDMQELGLAYENMNYADGKTRRTLLSLLERSKNEAGFAPRGAKLFIEVYPTGEGGCCLHFTTIRRPARLSESQGAIPPSIFDFDDVENLIEGACKVFNRYSHRIYKSSLYYINGRYRLLMYNLDYSDKLSVYFMSEFAETVIDNELLAAYTIEHGNQIISGCALDILAEHFGQ